MWTVLLLTAAATLAVFDMAQARASAMRPAHVRSPVHRRAYLVANAPRATALPIPNNDEWKRHWGF